VVVGERSMVAHLGQKDEQRTVQYVEMMGDEVHRMVVRGGVDNLRLGTYLVEDEHDEEISVEHRLERVLF
jgi:hypothetical protein